MIRSCAGAVVCMSLTRRNRAINSGRANCTTTILRMRIAGITLPDNKRLEIGLTAIYGIGRPLAHRLLTEASVNPGLKAKDLSTEQENAIRAAIEHAGILIEGELRREVGSHIKRLKDINSYRGTRHTKRLPCRGQSTKTNARTLKGERKTMGSGRRKVEKK